MKTILVAVDFSDSTERVVETVRQLAAATKSRVVLLHVREEDPLTQGQFSMSPGSFIPAPPTVIHAETPVKIGRLLDELKGRFEGLPVEVITRQSEGIPETMILHVEEQEDADMIIMGSHGHGAVYNLLVGSVTAGVLKKARCPVLVVPSLKNE